MQPPVSGPTGEDVAPIECDVSVSFGSFGPGIDGPLKARVLELVQGDSGVTNHQESRWGMEGESTLCIRTRDTAASSRLYAAIAEMLPTVSPRAPTTVTHRDGRTQSAGQAARKP